MDISGNDVCKVSHTEWYEYVFNIFVIGYN